VGFELTTLVVIGTDCISNCKSNYHMITTMMAAVIWRTDRQYNGQKKWEKANNGQHKLFSCITQVKNMVVVWIFNQICPDSSYNTQLISNELHTKYDLRCRYNTVSYIYKSIDMSSVSKLCANCNNLKLGLKKVKVSALSKLEFAIRYGIVYL
jgi:hypothetical protein